jgi:hypothetical protein
MDQNLGNNRSADQGSEDASQAREHVNNAAENRDALAAQNRRVEATAPPEVQSPINGNTRGGGSGMNAAGTGNTGNNNVDTHASEDTSAAREHVHNAEENRDALEAQNRRVEATAPEETRHDLRDNNNNNNR